MRWSEKARERESESMVPLASLLSRLLARSPLVQGLCLALLLLLGLPAYAADVSLLRVSPGNIEVGLGYAGADLLVTGAAPPGTRVLVKVSSQPTTVTLGRKERIMGLFWMTTERVVAENVPSFHAVYTSHPGEALLGRADQVRIGVDAEYVGLMGQARVATTSGDGRTLSAEEARQYLVGLRDAYVESGNYLPGAIGDPSPSGEGVRPARRPPDHPRVEMSDRQWSLALRLPAHAPLGEYQVATYYVGEGGLIHSEFAGFQVQKAGLARILSEMATHDAPLYGGASLVAVVLAGLSIGSLFSRKRR